MRRIDLHVHSTYSDGTCTPEELVQLAVEADLAAFALTDHDTAAGIPRAKAAAEKAGIPLIPGIEISVSYHGKDIHMLGLGIRPDSQELDRKLQVFADNRKTRNDRMIALLNEHGYRIDLNTLVLTYPNSVITRAHIARFLSDTEQIPDMKYAFDNLVGEGGSCYIPKALPDPMEAMKMIQEAGGKPVLAHPNLYHMTEEEQITMVEEFLPGGLFGIEAIYSMNSETDERRTRKIASTFGLAITGGSDFHGTNKPHIRLGVGRGSLFVPEELKRPFLP